MKRTITAATVTMLALLAGGVASAQADGIADHGRDTTRAQLVAQLDARFAQLDTDRDGFISAAERTAAHDRHVAERFARLDADKNGAVTLAEMKAARGMHDAAPGERRGRPGPRGMRGMHGMGGGLGGEHAGMGRDADQDGRISKAEFGAAALSRFDRADTDRNGVLSDAERQAARAAMKGHRGD
jgi:hypothetical protein